jgi:hypothetical protein
VDKSAEARIFRERNEEDGESEGRENPNVFLCGGRLAGHSIIALHEVFQVNNSKMQAS